MDFHSEFSSLVPCEPVCLPTAESGGGSGLSGSAGTELLGRMENWQSSQLFLSSVGWFAWPGDTGGMRFCTEPGQQESCKELKGVG